MQKLTNHWVYIRLIQKFQSHWNTPQERQIPVCKEKKRAPTESLMQSSFPKPLDFRTKRQKIVVHEESYCSADNVPN
jgi:hypothetical protein